MVIGRVSINASHGMSLQEGSFDKEQRQGFEHATQPTGAKSDSYQSK